VESDGVKRKFKERWHHVIKRRTNVVVSACKEGEGWWKKRRWHGREVRDGLGWFGLGPSKKGCLSLIC